MNDADNYIADLKAKQVKLQSGNNPNDPSIEKLKSDIDVKFETANNDGHIKELTKKFNELSSKEAEYRGITKELKRIYDETNKVKSTSYKDIFNKNFFTDRFIKLDDSDRFKKDGRLDTDDTKQRLKDQQDRIKLLDERIKNDAKEKEMAQRIESQKIELRAAAERAGELRGTTMATVPVYPQMATLPREPAHTAPAYNFDNQAPVVQVSPNANDNGGKTLTFNF